MERKIRQHCSIPAGPTRPSIISLGRSTSTLRCAILLLVVVYVLDTALAMVRMMD